MAHIRIGTTCSGKPLLVDGAPMSPAGVDVQSDGFTDHDLFDFAAALNCLYVAERRRGVDSDWCDSLEWHLAKVEERAGPHVIQSVREELGIVSAFAARDHGKKCLASHFRG